MQNFMWLAFGVAALLVELALAAVLFRLRGTLGAVEELLETTNEELKETLPEVRQTIGNVNDITAGVNVGLRAAGTGASSVGHGIKAAADAWITGGKFTRRFQRNFLPEAREVQNAEWTGCAGADHWDVGVAHSDCS